MNFYRASYSFKTRKCRGWKTPRGMADVMVLAQSGISRERIASALRILAKFIEYQPEPNSSGAPLVHYTPTENENATLADRRKTSNLAAIG